MVSILLVPIAPADAGLIESVCEPLERIVGRQVVIDGNSSIDTLSAFDAGRSQYNSTLLLTSLLKIPNPHQRKIVGVTAVDLFVPVLTYVFGEAQLDGVAAVVSSFRLENSFYGLPPDRKLTRDRLLKEIVHELGHTFGLFHCPVFECVMHSSTSVDEIDLKNALFCNSCGRKLLRQDLPTP